MYANFKKVMVRTNVKDFADSTYLFQKQNTDMHNNNTVDNDRIMKIMFSCILYAELKRITLKRESDVLNFLCKRHYVEEKKNNNPFRLPTNKVNKLPKKKRTSKS